MSNLSLGHKVRIYRIRAGMSQLELENELEASSGYISRVEVGKINPTKESIAKLTQVLKLSRQEAQDLVGFSYTPPTPEEVSLAIESISGLLNREDLLMYLLDECARIWAVSKGLILALNIKPETIEQCRGRNLIELLSSPQFPFKDYLDPKYFVEVIGLEFTRIKAGILEQGANQYYGNLIEDLRRIPGFDEVEKYSETVGEELALAGSRYSYLSINSQKLRFNHARENLKQNHRFRTIQLFNPVPYE